MPPELYLVPSPFFWHIFQPASSCRVASLEMIACTSRTTVSAHKADCTLGSRRPLDVRLWVGFCFFWQQQPTTLVRRRTRETEGPKGKFFDTAKTKLPLFWPEELGKTWRSWFVIWSSWICSLQLCVGFLFLILYPGSLPPPASLLPPPSACHTLSLTYNNFTHTFVTYHLSRTITSHTHKINTQLCHIQSVTYISSRTTFSHTIFHIQ